MSYLKDLGVDPLRHAPRGPGACLLGDCLDLTPSENLTEQMEIVEQSAIPWTRRASISDIPKLIECSEDISLDNDILQYRSPTFTMATTAFV
jgi:hypothetical protein